MGISATLLRWGLGALFVAGLFISIYALKLQKDKLTLERDNAVAAASAYKSTLSAYQDQFAAQARALNTEKGREIARQGNLLRTLNLIGDIDENENSPVSGPALSIIDGLYGYGPKARNN